MSEAYDRVVAAIPLLSAEERARAAERLRAPAPGRSAGDDLAKLAPVCQACGRPHAHALSAWLTHTQCRIVNIIAALGGRGVTHAEIARALYADRPDGGPLAARCAVGSYLHQIKKRIAGTRYSIICRGHHYMLEVESEK